MERDETKVTVKMAACPACQGWILLSVMPDAETDASSRREFLKCIKAGDVISIIPLLEAREKAMCECPKDKKGNRIQSPQLPLTA